MTTSPGLRLRRFASLASFTAFVVASAATGCGPSENRYYCDETGCFSCDGYGCVNVAAPTPASCTGQASCPSGTVCTEGGCLKSCQVTGDCDRGTVCKMGVCAAPTETPGKTKECSTKADCGSGKICEGGACLACGGSNGPCPCASASDCASDQTCSANQCVPKANVCKYASECQTGQSCVNGQCVASCTDDAACNGGTCKNGLCQPKPPQTSCTSDAQCSGATPKCLAGKCVAPCTGDAECGAGNYCNQGACAPDTRPKPVCTTQNNAVCAANQSCVEGYCKYPCATDNDCKIIDARIGYCGKDKVCRTPQEANPQCTSQADCASGQSCVDNSCK